MPSFRKFSRRGKVLSVAALVALVAGLYALRIPDRVAGPWAFADPPLTATWQGELSTPTGRVFPARLVLRLVESRTGPGRGGDPDTGLSRMEGDLVLCEGADPVAFAVDGQPERRDGHRFSFFTTAVRRHDGLTPGWFNAAWNGADVLEGAVSYAWREGESAITGHGYPDTEGRGRFRFVRAERDAQIDCAPGESAAPPGP